MSATLNEQDVGGYSVAYVRDDIYFPVYITAALAAIFGTAAWITGAIYWLPLAVVAAGFTYYNIPLLETGRPTIGANQYGIFIQAFGLIRWRAIERIDLEDRPRRTNWQCARCRLAQTAVPSPLDALAVAHGPQRRGTGQSGAV
jgi:hypothetical protein